MEESISKEEYFAMEKSYNEQAVELAKSKEELDKYKNWLIARKQIGTEMEKQRRHRQRWFTKVYQKNNQKIIRSELKPDRAEAAFLYYVIPFVNYSSNLIVTEKGIPMTIKRLIELTGFGKTALYRLIKGLKSKNMVFEIRENGQTYYGVNKDYIGDGYYDIDD